MILMKDIIREGHPTLTRVADKVAMPISDEDKQIAFSLFQYVINSQDDEIAQKYKLRPGVGIAAPQINVSKRMFAMHVHDVDGKLYSMIVVNPRITQRSEEIVYLNGGEGCLSVDRPTEGITPRHYSIKFEAFVYDVESNGFKLKRGSLKGYPATVFQHEFDHLDGIMFTTKMYPLIPGAQPLFDETDVEEENIAE